MRLLLGLLVGLSLCSTCRAQAPAWSRVESLPAGTRLIVTDGRAVSCRMIDVADDGLLCASPFGGFWLPRSRISRVNLASDKAVVIGTVAGIVAGGLSVGLRSEGDPFGIVAGGALGGFVGYLIGHLFAFNARGKLLYVQP